MSERVDVIKLKNVIKSVIKKRGLQYKDLASALDVSIPTVNRILNKEDLSLERLHDILQWLGLSFYDVAKISRDLQSQITEHSPEQEKFLAQNPQHLLVFEEFRQGNLTFDEIKQKYNLTQKSIEQYMADLEKERLIERYPDGRVKPLIEHNRWRRGGELRKTYGPKIGKIFSETTLKTITKGEKEDPSTHHRGSLGILLSENSFQQLKKEIDELERKYRSLSKLETSMQPKEELNWVIYTLLVAMKDIRLDLYAPPRNFE